MPYKFIKKIKLLTLEGSLLSLLHDRAVEQLVARWAHNPKVTGSNPVRANKWRSSSVG